MADEPSNTDLQRQLNDVRAAVTEIKLTMADMHREQRGDIRELVAGRDEVTTERLKGLGERIGRMEAENTHRTGSVRNANLAGVGAAAAAVAAAIVETWLKGKGH